LAREQVDSEVVQDLLFLQTIHGVLRGLSGLQPEVDRSSRLRRELDPLIVVRKSSVITVHVVHFSS
jgi:hypothetical protein